MKVYRMNDVDKEPATSELFTGNPVTRQRVLQPGESGNFNFGIVSFSAGSRNKFHKHSGDQILIITEGTGKVTTDDVPRIDELPPSVGQVATDILGTKHRVYGVGPEFSIFLPTKMEGPRSTLTSRPSSRRWA